MKTGSPSHRCASAYLPGLATGAVKSRCSSSSTGIGWPVMARCCIHCHVKTIFAAASLVMPFLPKPTLRLFFGPG